ncbi:mechanosensitive ion channel family protein [Sanyastnella coralliicola]|uniref:mechanosensitive ion channel family protein n=1 Tax=Sanyastnella coralliicola TaxID=3069118 RepID=UPI0027B9C86F|nr:mechanosensitive ion channel domain-containing protein [Longitalea sp. SCSIO 12813]
MENIDWNAWIDKGGELIMSYAPKVLLAILVLIIGMRIIKLVQKAVRKACDRSKMEEALKSFVASLAGWILKIVLFIAVADMVGVETTSFVAIVGAAGLAVGLALQGTLANFAGGVLIMIFKPYKVGSLVESQGVLGVVKEIQIFNTVLLTPENKTAIMPNGAVMNNHLINYTREGKIRVDLTIGVSYDSDIKQAKEVMMNVMLADDRVLKDPAPTCAVSALADSSVNFAVRPWCHPDHYWDVYFDTLENCKLALDNANISIPFPQVDVHMINN